MPPTRKTSCLRCHQIRPHAGRGLCTACLKLERAAHDRARQGTRERSHYAGDWRKTAASLVDQHIATHGLTGACGHTVTTRTDLTVDHIKPRTRSGGLVVICRVCNAKKGNDATGQQAVRP